MRRKYMSGCIIALLVAVSTAVSGCSSANDAQKEQLRKENAELSTKYAELMKNNTSGQTSVSDKTVSDNNVSVSDINVPININGAPANVECYNINGKIYVRLSDVGEYLGFSPYFDNNIINIKQNSTVKGAYDYYSELKKVPKFESVSPAATRLDLNLPKSDDDILAEFAYKASASDVQNYKNALVNEGFEYLGTIDLELMGISGSYNMYQTERRYMVVVSEVQNTDMVVVAIFDHNPSMVSATSAPAASAQPEQTSNPENQQS